MKALEILVVEDDSLIAMLLVETLVEMGHGVPHLFISGDNNRFRRRSRTL